MALSRFFLNFLLVLWANAALGYTPAVEESEASFFHAFTCDHSAESSSPPTSCPVPTEDEDRDEEEDDGNTEVEGLKELGENTHHRCCEPPTRLEKARSEDIGHPPKYMNA